MGRRGLVMATLLLAGCIPSSEPRRAEPSRGEPRAARSDPTTRQCLADLARDGIEFEILPDRRFGRSEEHTSELQSLMRISYAVFCLKKKQKNSKTTTQHASHSDIIK